MVEKQVSLRNCFYGMWFEKLIMQMPLWLALELLAWRVHFLRTRLITDNAVSNTYEIIHPFKWLIQKTNCNCLTDLLDIIFCQKRNNTFNFCKLSGSWASLLITKLNPGIAAAQGAYASSNSRNERMFRALLYGIIPDLASWNKSSTIYKKKH